ncbi:MAG: D-alanyl-D-alanine carboxypeptidase/D-alanyl-D-alanine-endopeptidase [Legionellales bacterium]|nr:D-alanyl-D-alanine carboxypeptidase/D-alanyl-D-alanine-endopeptidase [Legionellales bacterium]
MAWWQKSLCQLLFWLGAGINIVQASPQQTVAEIVDHYQQPFLGVVVQDITSKQTLVNLNGFHLFQPASNLKILTATAALISLGDHYRFHTQLLSSIAINAQSLKQSVFSGDIILKFDGDPSLTRENIYQLLVELKNHTIQGNFYIQTDRFGSKGYGPGWMWDDENSCFSAPVSSVIIDRNCFPLTLKAGVNAPTINEFRYQSYFKFSNQVQMVSTHDALCPLDLSATRNNEYTLSGCMSPKPNEMGLDIAIKNPALFATQLVRDDLIKLHINLTGKIINQSVNRPLYLFKEHDSAPLMDLITTMLKKSDNLYADSLLKTLGANYFHTSGTWENGVLAVKKILSKNIGLDFKHIAMYDGAGGSRYDLISPADLIRVLEFAYHNLNQHNEFIDALPISGMDGTLRGRMQSPEIRSRVKAKTGTMKGVSNLSGYVFTHNNHVLVFSIMINNFVGKTAPMRALEDRLCRLMVQW